MTLCIPKPSVLSCRSCPCLSPAPEFVSNPTRPSVEHAHVFEGQLFGSSSTGRYFINQSQFWIGSSTVQVILSIPPPPCWPCASLRAAKRAAKLKKSAFDTIFEGRVSNWRNPWNFIREKNWTKPEKVELEHQLQTKAFVLPLSIVRSTAYGPCLPPMRRSTRDCGIATRDHAHNYGGCYMLSHSISPPLRGGFC